EKIYAEFPFLDGLVPAAGARPGARLPAHALPRQPGPGSHYPGVLPRKVGVARPHPGPAAPGAAPVAHGHRGQPAGTRGAGRRAGPDAGAVLLHRLPVPGRTHVRGAAGRAVRGPGGEQGARLAAGDRRGVRGDCQGVPRQLPGLPPQGAGPRGQAARAGDLLHDVPHGTGVQPAGERQSANLPAGGGPALQRRHRRPGDAHLVVPGHRRGGGGSAEGAAAARSALRTGHPAGLAGPVPRVAHPATRRPLPGRLRRPQTLRPAATGGQGFHVEPRHAGPEKLGGGHCRGQSVPGLRLAQAGGCGGGARPARRPAPPGGGGSRQPLLPRLQPAGERQGAALRTDRNGPARPGNRFGMELAGPLRRRSAGGQCPPAGAGPPGVLAFLAALPPPDLPLARRFFRKRPHHAKSGAL
ncbi:MAG: hypothetical protein AVDCRST_MAG56-6735, partial [uncultured Cytophagales bacterium]